MTINDLFSNVCKGDIWDSDESWSTNAPNFSRCLRHTILSWIPCTFLIVFSLFEIYSIRAAKPKKLSWVVLNTSRLFFTLIAVFANLIEFGFYIGKYFSYDKYPSVLIFTSVLKVITFAIVGALLLLQKNKGVPTLYVLWIFLLINIVCFIPTISQLCLHSDTFRPFEYYFDVTYFCLLLVLLILSSFADLPNESRRSFLKVKTEDEEFTREPCPESTASVPSRLVFFWYTWLTYLGYRKPLVTDDIFDLNEEEKNEVVIPAFEKNWYSSGFTRKRRESNYEEVRFEIKSRNRNVLKTIAKTYWYDLSLAIVFLVFSTASILLSPIMLQSLLRFISSNDPLWHGVVIAVGMFSANIVSNFNMNYYFLTTTKLSMKIQCCLTNLIYKKSLLISSAAKKTTTAGEVVNLMSVDTQRILDISQFFLLILTIPVEIVVAFWLMYNQLGYAAFGGLLVMVVSIPITFIFSTFARRNQVKQMKSKDERIKHLNETLNGMKVLKLYAWEPSFIKLISDVRFQEMSAFKFVAYSFSVIMFQWTFAPFMVALVSFAIYVFTDSSNVLTAEKIFVTLNLIEILRMPLSMLPQAVSYSVLAYVSSKRINKYLNATELEDYVTRYDSDFAVEVENGVFRWETSESEGNDDKFPEMKEKSPIEDTLSDINVNVRMGSLHAVVGQVGSGKSSFLSSLLGEMEKVNGSVNINRRLKIAYVSQQAWIQNLTLRDNILFGKEYHKEKYEKVLDACALRPDLEILPAGDLTEIGEKGINLSGGQKQRVSLARAVYSDADLFLFDDPLSAVDAHVAKHLFNHLLSSNRGLLKDKTRILVTNRLDILSKVDFITVLKDGKVSEQGTYSELMNTKNEFADFMKQFSGGRRPSLQRQISTQSSTSEPDDEKKEETKKSTLIEEETAEVGRVKFSIYKKYIKMVSIGWCIVILVTICGFHLSSVAGNVWLSQWSSDNVTGDADHDNSQRNYRITIYGVIGVLQTLTAFISNFSFIKAGLQTAITLHSNLLNRIFRSPMSFFETTPLGRILNRFSKDMDCVDLQLPFFMKDVLFRMFEFVFAIGVIAAKTGFFILILVPLIIAYYFIQRIYIPSSRQLQRLQSITRSPIYAHFSQTLQGVSTIRAFTANDRFINDSNKRVELNLMCYFANMVGNRWLGVLLNTFGSLVVLFVGFYATFQRDALTAGVVGLTVSYAFTITQTLIWMVRSAAMVETNIVSVERINEYCENETEAEWVNEANKPPVTWPEKGVVQFDNYATRYRAGLDLVLKDVSASVNSSEKIGIVGRTGAGKSTITLSLFRIIEAAEGKILIDNLNIANLGLHDLRTKLTIIPQDPVLFSGTLRFNLDPFDAYTDDQIWEALKHSHLHQFASGLEKGLSHEIAEGGENLSVGQRQLMCLARALLRKSKILILDEATAAVDLETDSLIQNTIKTEFADCTTLTIAHRIQTILDCDRVIVIDKGSIVEFDSPTTLLSNKNSSFYSLAKNAGIVS